MTTAKTTDQTGTTNNDETTIIETMKEQGVPVSLAMEKNLKGKKAKKAAKAEKVKEPKEGEFGLFTKKQIKSLIKATDKKFPQTFKSWARKFAKGYDNTLEAFRSAYESDMKVALEKQVPKKMQRNIRDHLKVIALPEGHKLRDIHKSLNWLRRNDVISGVHAPVTVNGNRNTIHIMLTFTIRGMEMVEQSLSKKDFDKTVDKLRVK